MEILLIIESLVYFFFQVYFWYRNNPFLLNKLNIFQKMILNNICLETNKAFFLNINFSLFYNEYIIVLIFLLIGILLSLIIIGLSYFLVVQNPETEKLSSYECGFEPYEDARHKFDVKFYLVAILFIIFDIETMFLLPWCVSLSNLDLLGFWSMIDFIIELGVGFIYIWYIGALDWD
uniref:NADH-ubiquinone oxidoreductase chain 3 n=1 Tax=Lithodesmium undulatum TaxID=59812 RepID=A0A7T6UZM9_LITUN|nr:NADH dehydrogenase subunit 3 [Lithodesmium undulatum]QQJ94636.1 NADH dehydrogenase subunit 3 [Lithodesmium undulatum]